MLRLIAVLCTQANTCRANWGHYWWSRIGATSQCRSRKLKKKKQKWCTWSDRVCCHLGGGGSVNISHDRWTFGALIAWTWSTKSKNGTHVHALHIEFRLRIQRFDCRNFKYVNCPRDMRRKKKKWNVGQKESGDLDVVFFFWFAKRSECTREYETCCMINYIYSRTFRIPVHFFF